MNSNNKDFLVNDKKFYKDLFSDFLFLYLKMMNYPDEIYNKYAIKTKENYQYDVLIKKNK